MSPGGAGAAASGHSAHPEGSDRWRARFSKARQQSSRFFAGLLHRNDKHRDKHGEGEEGDDEEQLEEDEQPRVTFDPFHTGHHQHGAESPSSRASFLSHLPPIEEQLHRLQSAHSRPTTASASSPSSSHPPPLPPFFVLVDATGPRGRRLLRWLTAAAESSSSASHPSPFSGVLAITSSRDVQSAFNGLVALYRRHHSVTSTSTSSPLRLALAGPDSLLSRLLPAYIATLTTSPSLPIRVYPIPLYSSAHTSAPSSSRVCAYLASVDNLYLSLFFSSAYQHAFDGTSVEAEGAVVLDAIARYVMDAAVTIKLPLGEVNIESAAAAAHSQQSGGRDRDREEKESPHPHPPQLSSSQTIPRPHPAPVQVPPATELVSAPGLVSPSAQLHAVSAPVHISDDKAREDDDEDALSTTPPHRTMPLPATLAPVAAAERAERAAGRVTLPFVSDVAFLSSIHIRARTTSDSELHKPPLHLQHSHAAIRAAEEQHSIAVHPPEEAQHQHHVHYTDADSERKSGEHKKSGSVLSTFNKALLSITRTSSAADGGRHTKNATSVQLPPASALFGSKSDSSRMARLHKRRNSDSQTQYRGESAGHPATHPAASTAPSTIPADLLHAPLLNRRISLSWFTSGTKDKVRRGSVDTGSGAGAGGGKIKKSNAKGTFERVLVQRIVDDGSVLQADKKSKEHKRSFMEQAMHSITHLPSASPSPASSTASSSLAAPSSDHSTFTAPSASSSPSSHHHLHPPSSTPSVPSLSANQLLLLARRRPPKESSLLQRLRDDSSYTCRSVTKVIVSAVGSSSSTHSSSGSSSASSAATASSASSHPSGALGGSSGGGSSGSGMGGGVADLACLVDGVEVVGVSVVSVSAQVSGRVKSLAVQLFSAPASAPS